jgi:hypothetical protein
MDVSAFDFMPAELAELLLELAQVARSIEIEPRLHQADEMARVAEGLVKMHEGLEGPTFRIRLQLRAGDKVIAGLASLESSLGISDVVDPDGLVRLRHVRR